MRVERKVAETRAAAAAVEGATRGSKQFRRSSGWDGDEEDSRGCSGSWFVYSVGCAEFALTWLTNAWHC